MKRLFLLLITILPLFSLAQSVPGCGTFTSHAPITLSGVSNQTISGDSINASGGQFCIRLINCTNIHITKCKIMNASTASYSGGIDIQGGSHITVDTCYFENDSYGILVQNVTGGFIVNNYNYFKNCEQVGRPTKGGCSIQWNNVNGGGLRANYNKSYHTTNNVNIGDQFSFFKVNGLATDYMQHYYNEVEGGSIESSGLAGTVLGDLGGSYQDGEFNTYVTAGMEGCQVQGGHDIIMSNNRIYSNRLPVSTVGLAFGNYTNPFVASYNITMANNKINFINAAGQVSSIWFDPHTAFSPTGWASNTPVGQADASIQANMLPVPLFGACAITIPKPVISYNPSSYVFTTGLVIPSIQVINTGGSSNQWSSVPSLPSGLSISNNGTISGTPLTITSPTNYVISAVNGGGTGITTINIQTKSPVIVAPNIAYNPNVITATVGVPINAVTPSNNGGTATSFSIDSPLPSNFSFNTSNGSVSGTGLVASPTHTYTVMAVNGGGSSSTPLVVTVNSPPLPAPNITYPYSSVVWNQNQGITPTSPTNSGGTAASYSVFSGSLPAGVILDPLQGTLSGVPTTVTSSPQSVTIRATNTSGHSDFSISYAINSQPVFNFIIIDNRILIK